MERKRKKARKKSRRQTFSVKFIYSEKATKFCEISTNFLSYVLPVKSKVKISQNFMAFLEYLNFKKKSKLDWQKQLTMYSQNLHLGHFHVLQHMNYCLSLQDQVQFSSLLLLTHWKRELLIFHVKSQHGF